MKIRTGFVSNSSSSSFVAVGFNLNDEKINLDKTFETLGVDFVEEYEKYLQKIRDDIDNPKRTWVKQDTLEEAETSAGKERFERELLREVSGDLKLNILQGDEDGVGEDDLIICEFIADISDDDFVVQKAYPLSELESQFAYLKEVKEKIAPESELSIYTGVRMC